MLNPNVTVYRKAVFREYTDVGFAKDGLVRIQHSFRRRIILEVVLLAVNLICAGGSVVPVNFVGRDVVSSGPAGLRCRERLWRGEEQRDQGCKNGGADWCFSQHGNSSDNCACPRRR